MGDVETRIGGSDHRFPSTVWYQVTHAEASPGPDGDPNLQRLIGLYWKPVYCTIRHAWARSNEDAKDLTQEFFLKVVLEGSLLDKYTPERGSFRALLKASVANFMRMATRDAGRLKRGGGARTLRLDDIPGEVSEFVPDAASLTPDEVFDSAWKKTVWARAVRILEERLRAEGKEATFEVFRRYALDGDGAADSYASVGRALDLTPDGVKNALTRAREELRKIVVEILREYVDNADDLNREIKGLLGA